jgi:[protein-PII] uridylyltransferase
VAATLATALPPAGAASAARWKRELAVGREAIRAAFVEDHAPHRLLAAQSRLVDRVLRGLWADIGAPAGCALIAVGGYGRGQLFPFYDVDVMILLARHHATLLQSSPSASSPALGYRRRGRAHAVRTIAECETEMAGDITIRTSLLEHRQIAGSRSLYQRFRRSIAATIDARAFYEAKALEQQQRHLRYQDTAYNLEPNVKESPGGLRDLQTIVWIARAAGLGRSWHDFAARGLMTGPEAREVVRQERLLCDLRIRLHYLAGRREDRLVFDVQTALARDFGLADTAERRASELLMQRYYRAAKSIRQISVVLLQNVHSRLFPAELAARPIDADFQAVDELLDLVDEQLFVRRPAAIFESFLTLQQHPELKGMSARTLRALWRNRNRVDAAFRREPANRARFIEILRQPRGVTHELRRMNQYGILGRYLPLFGRIVGQMQHDLFHVYTVDEHILMVIRNLRRFTEAQHAHEYPLCSRLIADFARPEVHYIAGLFHHITQ